MTGGQFNASADMLLKVAEAFKRDDLEITMTKFRELELEKQLANARDEIVLVQRRIEDRLLAHFWGGVALGAVAVAAIWIVVEVVR